MAISWDGSKWAPSTPYLFGARVVWGSALNPGGVYTCVATGTSAASGGPTGTTTAPITDGSVTWLYLGPFAGSVLSVAPEIESGSYPITPSAQLVFLNYVESIISDPCVWVNGLDVPRLYLAAHLAELSRQRGRGPVTSETVGPMSQATASLMGPLDLDLTPAGRVYASMVNQTTMVFGFTG